MGGKPNLEGARAVVGLLDRIAALNLEIAELKPKADRLRSAETAVANLHIELKRALGEMDLESRGNTGFEARLAWFLAEVRRVVKEESP